MSKSDSYGTHFSDEVRNVIRLTLAFANAVAARQEDPADNVVVSPYNHLRFLSMVAKGTTGETRREMAEVLFGVSAEELDDEIERLITLNRTILDANKDQVTLKTATAFWANSDQVTLSDKYVAELERLFESRIGNESFNNPALAAEINGWAHQSTDGLISKIIDKLDGDMAAFLASALYFRGLWTSKFDQKLTEPRAYTADGGAGFQTPTMRQFYSSDSYMLTYQHGDDYEAATLTFGQRDPEKRLQPTVRLILVRPVDDAQTARDWLASQDSNTVPAWLDPRAYEHVGGVVELPHLQIKQRHKLIPALQDAGLYAPFDKSGDYAPMVTQGGGKMSLDEVNEDIVFEADELGVKFASIVSGRIMTTSFRPPPRMIDFKLNRSFVVAAQDIKTGAVLFAGVINKPNENMTPTPKP